jgi:ketosteroid isomerase-like protein
MIRYGPLLAACALLMSVLGTRRAPAQAAPGTTVSPEAQRARQQVEQANAQYVKAFGDADVTEVVSLYDTAATELLPKGRVVRGRAALLAYWGAWIKSIGPIKLTLDVDEFWLLGDRAFDTGTYTTVFKTKADTAATVSGNYATLWTHEADGSWKILAVFDTPK